MKKIIIGLAVLSLIATVFIVYKTRQSSVTPSVTPPKPSIPSAITGTLPIEILVKKEDFNFPSRLPILSIAKRVLDKDAASAFAEKLGLGPNLEEFDDVNEGIKYYVNSENYFFVATSKTSTVKFGLATSELPEVIKKNITDDEFISIAERFLAESGFYSEDKVKALPVLYFKASPGSEGLTKTTRASAGLFQTGFTFASSDYEILTSGSSAPQIFIQVLPDGTIYSAEVLLINGVQKGITDYPLKNYEDVSASLSQAKLIDLSGDYISPSDLTISDIVKLQVEKIRLAYFLEPGKENFLQPIYILEGPATISGSSADSATLYMPAYK